MDGGDSFPETFPLVKILLDLGNNPETFHDINNVVDSSPLNIHFMGGLVEG